MISVESRVEIARPVEAVFAYVSDVTNDRRWQTDLGEVKLEGPLAVGGKRIEIRTFLGRRVENVSEITAFEPNRTIAFRGTSGPVRANMTYDVAPSNGGTTFTLSAEMDARGFFKLADPFLGRALKRSMEASLGNLKDLLETESDQESKAPSPGR